MVDHALPTKGGPPGSLIWHDDLISAQLRPLDRAPAITIRGWHRLRQVAANLVDNALVHTPASAAVEVAVRHQSARVWPGCVVQAGDPPPTSSTWAVLEVGDNGPGVAADSAPHVFDRLYRAGRTRARPGSTGLGRAIAAAILSAHRGCIVLLNTPEGGATFRVLPAPA